VIDLHVHTWRCRHAEGAAAEYVRVAAERGVSTLCFTEHLPMPPSLIERIAGAEGVLLGIEIDAVPEAREHAAALLGAYPFDLVLGSVHFIDAWAFDDPDKTGEYDRWDYGELWERYFTDLVDAARSGLADVMAHADLVKKFCKRPDTPVGHLYGATADALSEAGVAVEVNTAGLHKPCRELYPGPDLLAELRRAGVPVTIGSDAHAPEQVALGTGEAIEALRSAGYRSVLVFRGRIAEEVGIDEL